MDDLIEALQIFRKYTETNYPTHCEHDIMYISHDVIKSDVSLKDLKRLDELGFFIDEESGGFASYKFGSC